MMWVREYAFLNQDSVSGYGCATNRCVVILGQREAFSFSKLVFLSSHKACCCVRSFEQLEKWVSEPQLMADVNRDHVSQSIIGYPFARRRQIEC